MYVANRLLFQSRPGLVQVIALGEEGLPAAITVTGDGNLAQQEGVIITGIGVSQQVNTQFMSSLQKILYIYSFGDRPGRVTINGLTFDRTCQTEGRRSVGPSNLRTRQTERRRSVGPSNLLQYYDRNRAIAENRLMKVQIGQHTIQGYMNEMNLNTSSPEFHMMSFSLTLITVPKQIGL